MHSVTQVWTFFAYSRHMGFEQLHKSGLFCVKNAVSLHINLQPLKSATQMRQNLPTWAWWRLKVVLPAASHSPPELLLF